MQPHEGQRHGGNRGAMKLLSSVNQAGPYPGAPPDKQRNYGHRN